jgi:altronate hydrolase
MSQLMGYERSDGRKGIRNLVAVAYLVECAHHVAREIAWPHRDQAHVIGFPGCFPNAYAQKMMERLCTHPNVGAVLLVSLGCESFNRYALEKVIRDSGRAVKSLVIQRDGGTSSTIRAGQDWIAEAVEKLSETPKLPMDISELVVARSAGAPTGRAASPAIRRLAAPLIDWSRLAPPAFSRKRESS